MGGVLVADTWSIFLLTRDPRSPRCENFRLQAGSVPLPFRFSPFLIFSFLPSPMPSPRPPRFPCGKLYNYKINTALLNSGSESRVRFLRLVVAVFHAASYG